LLHPLSGQKKSIVARSKVMVAFAHKGIAFRRARKGYKTNKQAKYFDMN